MSDWMEIFAQSDQAMYEAWSDEWDIPMGSLTDDPFQPESLEEEFFRRTQPPDYPVAI